MPSRKSNISALTNEESDTPGSARSQSKANAKSVEGGTSNATKAARTADESQGNVPPDLGLPRTMIQRLAKGVLPANTQIQKEALLALSKSATVFVSFLASNAGEYAAMNGKKTIMPNDVFAALEDQEFEAFLSRVQAEVTKYNEIQCGKRNSYRKRVKADKVASYPSAGKDEVGDLEGEAVDESTLSSGSMERTATNGRVHHDGLERPTKKVRRSSGDDLNENEDEEIGEDEDGEEEEEEEVAGEDDAEDELESEEEEEAEDGEDGSGDEESAVDGSAEELAEGHAGYQRDEALDEPDSD